MDQSTNHLRYKDNGSLFTNLIEYRGLYLINTITYLPPTPTTYATSTRFFKTSVYNRVWHQRLLHCNMESVNHLLTTANRVKVVKTDRGRTPYSIPLYKPYVLRKITQQISHRISIKGTYPFKRVHFDIIIKEDGFNGDTYIAYF